MAELALVSQDGQVRAAQEVAKPVRERIQGAKEHRKQYEGIWHLAMAFAAGNQWSGWDPLTRTLRKIQQLDPRYQGRELYTADIITERRMLALGELGSDDDRPELLLTREDKTGEDYQAQVNRALAYAWDFEFRADEVLAEADRLCVDLGTSAIRCRFDSSVGPVKEQNVPYQNGRPLLDEEAAVRAVAQAAEQGQTLSFGDMQEGRIRWEPLSALNLLPPPGVTHERAFPFDCIVEPVLLSAMKDEYGAIASDLREDTDIGSSLGLAKEGGAGSPATWSIEGGRDSRLRDHVWRYLYFERPTRQHPRGRVFHFAGGELNILRVDERLPYQAPDGTYRSGISYLHWWRTSGRFFSRGLVEALKDSQRGINKRRTQSHEIIDRNLPYVLAVEGSKPEREGLPMEIIYTPRDQPMPTPVQGFGPGDWMWKDVQELREDAERASGFHAVSLGEEASRATTYSELALRSEKDQVKRSPILLERKRAIARLVEDSVYDIRHYWGANKQLMLAGEDDQVEAVQFDATKIPAFYIVKIAKGAAKPRSQAAELKKIEDIWAAAGTAGAVQTRPDTWVHWLKESLEAGQAQELPDDPGDDQAEKAYLENHQLLTGAGYPLVAYYDPPEVHIPIHRSAQVQAELAGDAGAVERIEEHVQEHLVLAQQNAELLAAQMPTPEPELEAGPEQASAPAPA